MNGMTALALGYLGMLVALGVWTWTVMSVPATLSVAWPPPKRRLD